MCEIGAELGTNWLWDCRCNGSKMSGSAAVKEEKCVVALLYR